MNQQRMLGIEINIKNHKRNQCDCINQTSHFAHWHVKLLFLVPTTSGGKLRNKTRNNVDHTTMPHINKMFYFTLHHQNHNQYKL